MSYAAGRREDREGSGSGLRRVSAVRHRQLHLPRRLPAVRRRRRHGASQQHRGHRPRPARANALGTASHEFFHCWNVERIRPQGLEPFNFEEANLTDSLWVAEGFTQYYGSLIMGRAGLADVKRTVAGMGSLANEVINGSGRAVPIAGGDEPAWRRSSTPARSIDPTNFNTTFISYYSYGGAVALGLDLSLRDKTERQGDARRLHARDVEGVRQTRRAAARPRRQAVHAHRHSRSTRGRVGRSRVRGRLLHPLHGRPRGRGLRAAAAARRGRPARAQPGPRLGRRDLAGAGAAVAKSAISSRPARRPTTPASSRTIRSSISTARRWRRCRSFSPRSAGTSPATR